jgi:hypothetical protein
MTTHSAPTPSDANLRTLILQQQQHINRLHEELHSNTFAFGLKVFLSVVLQIACYLLFAFVIYFAIIIPSDFPSLMEMMREGRNPAIDLTLNIPALNEFLLGIKITLATISLPVLICALLLGRNRRKSRRIRRAFQELETMKKNFEAGIQGVKF